MTTLAAWVGVDHRAPSSLYIVSDSRFTALGHGSTPRLVTDHGRKVYACRNEPHIFGYWGWVGFPSRAIADAVTEIDKGGLFEAGDDISSRQGRFQNYLEKRLAEKLVSAGSRSKAVKFAVLHAAREGSGMESKFRLWILGWDPKQGWNVRERELGTESEVLYAAGSGAEEFLKRDSRWKDSELGRTSRGVFSAFVEHLKDGADPYSGGAPQLGGLFRRGYAAEFGVVYKGVRFLSGKRTALSPEITDLEWFNELFERIDPVTLERLPDAQRHAKPSWLRPR